MSQLRADVALSVADTAPVVEGSTAREALANTVDLARHADVWGFRRYWVAEHHSMRGVAAAAPAVVIGRIAAATQRIRVGSGGVLLPNHPPIVIAEQFGTLEAFYPGRIDLALGRALGGSKRAVEVVRSENERSSKPFAEQLDELRRYFTPTEDDPIRAVPAAGNKPPLWLLGSSDFSAQLAGSAGLPYAFAHHLNPGSAATAVQAYREAFHPSADCAAPTVLVSTSVIAADTDEDAEWLAGSTRLKVLSRHHGQPILLPSPEKAASYPYTREDRDHISQRATSVLTGSPDTVTKRLQGVLDDTGADELMITTPVFDHRARLRSYELVAQLSGIRLSLPPAAGQGRPAEVVRG